VRVFVSCIRVCLHFKSKNLKKEERKTQQQQQRQQQVCSSAQNSQESQFRISVCCVCV